MKKVTLFCLMGVLLTIMISSSRAQMVRTDVYRGETIYSPEDDGMIRYGYCTDKINFGIGTSDGTQIKAAIEIPKSVVKRYKGAQIVKLDVGLVTNHVEGITGFTVFLSESVFVAPFYTQDIKIAAEGGWNEITLDVPYELTDKPIVVGCQLSPMVGKSPMGFSKNTTNYMGDWVCLGGKWGHASSLPTETPIVGNVALRAVLSGDALPKQDVKLSNFVLNGYMNAGESVDICGTVINNGVEKVTELEVSYSVNDEAAVVCTFKDLNIMNGETYSFTHFTPWIPKMVGKYEIVLSVTKVNGTIDEYLADNSVSQTTVCQSESTQRKMVLEYFSTEDCVNCPAGNAYVKSVIGDDSRVIWITHHAGYGTDKFTIPESERYLWFYNGGLQAPMLMMDRLPNMPGPVQELDLLNKASLEARLAAPAYIKLEIAGKWDSGKRALNITASGKLLSELPGNNVQLNLFLTEDGIKTKTQAGADDYIQNHVIRRVLTDVFGDALPTLSADKGFSRDFELVIPSSWNAEKVNIIAFVANYDENNVNNCEVYNGESITLKSLISNNVENATAESVIIYPNPAQNIINVSGANDINSVTLFDLSGKIVKKIDNISSRYSIDTSDIENGVYIIECQTDKGSIINKVVIN